MKKMGVLIATIILNKFLLFGLLGATDRILTVSFLCLAILNFVILAKSVDKLVQRYQLDQENKVKISAS